MWWLPLPRHRQKRQHRVAETAARTKVRGQRCPLFGGAIVDVRAEDAEALIKSGNAEIQQESKPDTTAAALKGDDTGPPEEATPEAAPAAEDTAVTKTLEASSTAKASQAKDAPNPLLSQRQSAPSRCHPVSRSGHSI